MSYKIAGIDVHKKMLAVVVADVAVEGEYRFERRRFGGGPDQLQLLAKWLIQLEVQEAVMESTAQYWRPVWQALEQYWKPECQKPEGTARCPERCIWRGRSRIAGRGGAREIFQMPNVW